MASHSTWSGRKNEGVFTGEDISKLTEASNFKSLLRVHVRCVTKLDNLWKKCIYATKATTTSTTTIK